MKWFEKRPRGPEEGGSLVNYAGGARLGSKQEVAGEVVHGGPVRRHVPPLQTIHHQGILHPAARTPSFFDRPVEAAAGLYTLEALTPLPAWTEHTREYTHALTHSHTC